jgi:uncharacterized protein YoxC
MTGRDTGMRLKLLGYLGLAGLIGLLIQTMVTTYYLSKIDTGLTVNLQTTKQLIGIEHAINEKNKALQEVASTATQMDLQLNGTLQTTKEIHANINQIDQLNDATLQANQSMVTLGAQTGQTLNGISQNMEQLKQSLEALSDSLSKLYDWTNQDRNNMAQMKQATDNMNQKVPGVVR